KYVISEGSISVNGVSLTVARLLDTEATISLIPHTLEMTNLGDLEVGAAVNIEVDLIGKYVEKLLGSRNESKITEKWLQKAGYGA
ncbi:riboflavin synthase, partial [bacterium]|nr:riboflavin synthase [bacterium]